MKLLRTLAAVTAAASFTLIPAVANAATLSTPDASGDVRSSSTTAADPPSTPAPDRAEGDILNSRISHRAYAVTMKVRYRDLTRTGAHLHFFVIRTAKLYREVMIATAPGSYRGTVTMTNAKGKKVSCAISHTLDYVGNTAFVKIPRSCLADPGWVRVGIGTITISSDGKTVYGDDARTNGVLYNSNPVYSPRVYKG